MRQVWPSTVTTTFGRRPAPSASTTSSGTTNPVVVPPVASSSVVKSIAAVCAAACADPVPPTSATPGVHTGRRRGSGPGDRRRDPSWARTVAYAVAYALAIVVGRLIVLPETGLALFWPAAGVGALWALVSTGRRHLLLVSVAIWVMSAAGLGLSGLPAATALVLGVANIVNSVGTAVVYRWLDRPLVGARRGRGSGRAWHPCAGSVTSAGSCWPRPWRPGRARPSAWPPSSWAVSR